MQIVNQVVLQLRVVPQPTPGIYNAGDCGACVLSGLLKMTPEAVYKEFLDERLSFSWAGMRGALHEAESREQLDRINVDPPMQWPPVHESQLTFGMPAISQSAGWFGFARMAIDAGYYGIAEVDFGKGGKQPDHWVMLCGTREIWPDEGQSGRITPEILVSCSARSSPDEEWVSLYDFLEQRGGFHAFWARPAST